MNPDDFGREPRSGNTQLHKLNPYLNHNNQKKKTILTISLFVPTQLLFHSTNPKTIAT